MRFLRSTFVSIIVLSILVVACSPKNNTEIEKTPALVPFKETKITDTTTFANNIQNYDGRVGVAGVFDVPEMLVMSLLDSAAKNDLANLTVKNYAILEKEMTEVGAELNGPIGVISYNNDLENFVFESVVCIKRMPKKQPKQSKIVVLEASKMLVFNFYGPYQNLFSAYNKIETYCKKNDLIQSGPIREFYMTDPAKENNPEKWLTRIFLPVISMRK
jgi:effector-binding domain-containing protein